MASEPGVDLAFGLFLGLAIDFLNAAGQLFAVASDDIKVVSGQLAPLGLNLALELLPIAFDLIPVHRKLLVLNVRGLDPQGQERCAVARVPEHTIRQVRIYVSGLCGIGYACQASGGPRLKIRTFWEYADRWFTISGEDAGLRPHFASLVFVIFSLAGAFATSTTYRFEEAAARADFEVSADEIADRIRGRIEQHFTLLEATAAFVVEMGDQLSASNYASFVDRLALEQRYQGVRGLGIASMLPAGRDEVVSVSLQRNYRVERGIWPAVTSQEWRTPVVLLEPQDERNKAVLGFDMYQESNRRQAMLSAMATGRLTATAPIEVAQSAGAEKQMGFLVYLALPRPVGRSPDEREPLFAAFAYASFRALDFHLAAVGHSSSAAVDIETRDVTNGTDTLLYRSKGFESAAWRGYTLRQQIVIGGREWAISARAGADYPMTSHRFSWLVGIVFTALAVATAAATWWQMRAMEAAGDLHRVLKRAVDERDLLLQEMKHRIKNSIARILAIARQTGANASSIEDFNASFGARLQSMAKAQEILTGARGRRVGLRELLRGELEQVFGQDLADDVLSGPPVALDERLVQALGLTFHELATNALKYGAGGKPQMRMAVGWSVHRLDGRQWLHLEWKETGVPVDLSKIRRGFGSRLIDINIRQELGGMIERQGSAAGLVVSIRVPLADAPSHQQ